MYQQEGIIGFPLIKSTALEEPSSDTVVMSIGYDVMID